jgi:hypothetical protein
MKVTKTASGKNKIKISRAEWTDLGKKAGWMKKSNLNNFIFFDQNEKEIKPGDTVVFPGLFGMSQTGVIQNIRVLEEVHGREHLLEDLPENSTVVNVQFNFSNSTQNIGYSPGSKKIRDIDPNIDEKLLEPNDSYLIIECPKTENMISCFCTKEN